MPTGNYWCKHTSSVLPIHEWGWKHSISAPKLPKLRSSRANPIPECCCSGVASQARAWERLLFPTCFHGSGQAARMDGHVCGAGWPTGSAAWRSKSDGKWPQDLLGRDMKSFKKSYRVIASRLLAGCYHLEEDVTTWNGRAQQRQTLPVLSTGLALLQWKNIYIYFCLS